jgi:hypothetical protein
MDENISIGVKNVTLSAYRPVAASVNTVTHKNCADWLPYGTWGWPRRNRHASRSALGTRLQRAEYHDWGHAIACSGRYLTSQRRQSAATGTSHEERVTCRSISDTAQGFNYVTATSHNVIPVLWQKHENSYKTSRAHASSFSARSPMLPDMHDEYTLIANY